MSYTLKTNIANRANYGQARSTSKIKYIVVHYTGNDGDTDEANANYFKNRIVKSSAHYFVDGNSITQSVPDNYIAWHCGGGLQGLKGHKYWLKCTNTNSIGVELCDEKKNGKYDFTNVTINNAVALIKDLMKKYNVPASNVIRHYDVTGKKCPAPFVSDSSRWNDFKSRLTVSTSKTTQTSNKTSNTNSTYKTGTYQTLYNMKVRTGAGTKYRAKKRSELTADGKKNATITGSYKKGTKFTAQKIINNSDGSVWAKSPSGYICIKDKKQTYCKR